MQRVGESLIRDAAAADAPALAGLIGELGYAVTAVEVAARLVLVAKAGNRVLVAERDGAVVGCLTTAMTQVIHRPAAVGRISMMIVADGRRGQGIGAALVQAAEAALAAQGCSLVEVTSNLRRADAHRFYEKLGYERTSVRLAKTL